MKNKQDVYDYTQRFPRETPTDVRRKHNVGDIFENQIKCMKCGDVIRSKNLHDYVECGCKSCAVDGGSWYGKRIIAEDVGFIDMTTYYDDTKTHS